MEGVQQRVYEQPEHKKDEHNSRGGHINKDQHNNKASISEGTASEPDSTTSLNNTTQKRHSDRDILEFWQRIEKLYNISVEGHRYINVLQHMKDFIDKVRTFHIEQTFRKQFLYRKFNLFPFRFLEG